MPNPKTVIARAVAAALVAVPAFMLLAPATSSAYRFGDEDARGVMFTATPAKVFAQDPDRLVFVTVHWRNRAQLQRIASKFQHLIVDEKARTARTEANATELGMLRRMGVRVEIDDAATERMRAAEAGLARRDAPTFNGLRAQKSIPGYACYRTVEETYGTMNRLASQRGNLASVIDIGPSWAWEKSNGAAGNRMRVLRVTNAATNAAIPDKPNMVVLAAIHAREYTTAELVTRFSEWLVDQYGTDPDATWLVDNFRFHFILQANPDGRKKAETGLSWRKNTDTDNGSCSANAFGVDLNRNFTWQFGNVANGSSPDPCDATYRGPSSASETETQNLMRYIVGTRGSSGTFTGGVLPDLRTDTGTAPANYRGLFLDIHSFSQLVLWPWASTSTNAPNANALRTLGRRLAHFNGYEPKQWIGLYPADGTNTDTVYGITGAPSYTIELGQAFFESCSTFESDTYPRNLNALKYAARTLMAPYTAPAGPDTTSLGASARSVVAGKPFAVSAYVDDGAYNQSNGAEPVQNVTGVRAYLDVRPWIAGAPSIAMNPTDGAFNSAREQATLVINTRGLKAGRHVVYVRGTDSSGAVGTPRAVYFDVIKAPPGSQKVRQ